MGRYRRRSNHWMWQPRGLNGRFTKGGGSDDCDVFAMKGFWKLPNWGKLVYVVAMICLLVWVHGSFILGAIVFLVVLLGSDAILNALLPDEEEESEE